MTCHDLMLVFNQGPKVAGKSPAKQHSLSSEKSMSPPFDQPSSKLETSASESWPVKERSLISKHISSFSSLLNCFLYYFVIYATVPWCLSCSSCLSEMLWAKSWWRSKSSTSCPVMSHPYPSVKGIIPTRWRRLTNSNIAQIQRMTTYMMTTSSCCISLNYPCLSTDISGDKKNIRDKPTDLLIYVIASDQWLIDAIIFQWNILYNNLLVLQNCKCCSKNICCGLWVAVARWICWQNPKSDTFLSTTNNCGRLRVLWLNSMSAKLQTQPQPHCIKLMSSPLREFPCQALENQTALVSCENPPSTNACVVERWDVAHLPWANRGPSFYTLDHK